jgi:hypothetical protein
MRIELWVALGLFVMALRAYLIVAGIHKAPILRRFEVYGDERYYSPMLSLLAWGLGFIAYLIGLLVNPHAIVITVLFAFAPLVVIYAKADELVRDFPEVFTTLPFWYNKIASRTSRDDRRRLAYMWLRLPLRTRLLYSANDHHFMNWADLVLVAAT